MDDINDAMVYKNKVIQIDREDVKLPEGTNFIVDLIGLAVIDDENGKVLGKIIDVMNLPANDVYVVRGEREYMIPAVSEFIAETNVDGGYVRIRMQEGLAEDED